MLKSGDGQIVHEGGAGQFCREIEAWRVVGRETTVKDGER